MYGLPEKLRSRLLLMVVIGLAAYLRLADVGDNPGWYTDEATHLLIGQQLLKGHSQYLAVNQSTLLFARLPLFEWLLAAVGSLFGLTMFTLRLCTAVLTLITLLILTCIVWQTGQSHVLTLLTALLYAIYPQAAIYGRVGLI
jgi:4-amino-4-deoxy-L-arabinose transferase-like glycosyltransferase